MLENNLKKIKIFTIGLPKSGKSSLIDDFLGIKYKDNEYNEKKMNMAILKKIKKIKDEELLILIHDINGIEFFHVQSYVQSHKDCDDLFKIYIFTHDFNNNEQSLNFNIKFINKINEAHNNKTYVYYIFIICTKTDLIQTTDEIEIKNYIKENYKLNSIYINVEYIYIFNVFDTIIIPESTINYISNLRSSFRKSSKEKEKEDKGLSSLLQIEHMRTPKKTTLDNIIEYSNITYHSNISLNLDRENKTSKCCLII